MSESSLGKLITATRIKKQLSKVALCRGLCSVTALSRYESGKRIPDKLMADALLERLGLCPYVYEFISSEDEFFLSIQRKNIENLVFGNQFPEALSLIGKYEKHIKDSDRLHMQYLLFQKGMISAKTDRLSDSDIYFCQALNYTGCNEISRYRDSSIFLTSLETRILYCRAECLHAENREESFEIFEQLKDYIESVKITEKIHYYPAILYSLALMELNRVNLGRAYHYLQGAADNMLKNYRIDYLCEILNLKKEVEYRLHIYSFSQEDDDFLSALQIINSSEDGIITEEGMRIWANIVKQPS